MLQKVLCKVNFRALGRVKAAEIARAASSFVFDLIRMDLRSLRSAISASFHASPMQENLFYRALVLFVLLFAGGYGEEFPIMHEGRAKPYSIAGEPFSERLLVLPDRNGGDWHTLADLQKGLYNFTPYPDEVFYALKEAWGHRDEEAVKKLLAENAFSSVKGRLKAERLLYEYPWKVAAIGFYVASACSFLFLWRRLGMGFFGVAFALHTVMLVLRCYILERPPVSNMQETLIYVPWIASLLALFWVIRYKETLPGLVGTILASTLLLMPFNEGLDKVQPVLNSPFWLTVHVMMIVASYGVFIMSGLFAHIYVFTRNAKAFSFILPAMYIGVSLLIPGTILGGVWALESWGRFWDWDPKESWAFISAAVYIVVIHAWRYGKIDQLGVAIGSIVGMVAISFTWYGVNYILGTGLHSYGFGQGGELFYWIFLGLETTIICMSLITSNLKRNTPL